jgi:hypothetical protein
VFGGTQLVQLKDIDPQRAEVYDDLREKILAQYSGRVQDSAQSAETNRVQKEILERTNTQQQQQVQEQKIREEREASIKRQEIFSAVTGAAQAVAAQNRTNAAIDAQMKADAARRAAEQNRTNDAIRSQIKADAERRANVNSIPNSGTSFTPSTQPLSTGSTAGQMHSGSARDMPTASRGTQQGVVAPARQPAGSGTSTPVSVELSHRGEYITGGRANKFRVYVENKTSIRGNCVVNGTYEYVSDSNGQLTSTREPLPIILPANGQGYADFSRADRNVTMKDWEVSCSAL